jgi:predicted transcriptional regulator
MLKDLFGGKTAERVLLYLAAVGDAYPLEISRTFGISNTQVLRTVLKLEEAEILVGRTAGRVRLYSLSKTWYAANELKHLLDKALLQIPLNQQEKYFMRRNRPRKKGKRI